MQCVSAKHPNLPCVSARTTQSARPLLACSSHLLLAVVMACLLCRLCNEAIAPIAVPMLFRTPILAKRERHNPIPPPLSPKRCTDAARADFRYALKRKTACPATLYKDGLVPNSGACMRDYRSFLVLNLFFGAHVVHVQILQSSWPRHERYHLA